MVANYQVYVLGIARPIYQFKTWRGLHRRLRVLAEYSALTKITVKAYGVSIPVELFRTPYAYGWQSPVGLGIPYGAEIDGACGGMSAWQHSR